MCFIVSFSLSVSSFEMVTASANVQEINVRGRVGVCGRVGARRGGGRERARLSH